MSKKKRRKYRLHRHHRRPRSIGGSNEDFNISLVNRDQHVAWHQLFRNYEPKVIASMISAVWLDPDFYFIALPRKRAVPQPILYHCASCGKPVREKKAVSFLKLIERR